MGDDGRRKGREAIVTEPCRAALRREGRRPGEHPPTGEQPGQGAGQVEVAEQQAGRGQGPQHAHHPAQLAHGISIALYNTAFGLVIAIPSLIFYRHFRARVDGLVVEMEQLAVRFVDIVHGERK